MKTAYAIKVEAIGKRNRAKAVAKQIEEAKTATHANLKGWTDSEPYEIIEKRTAKKLIVRHMNSEQTEPAKLESIGGFSAHFDNWTQRYSYSANENATPIAIRLHANGQWKDANGNTYRLATAPSKFRDYNF